MGYNFTAIEKKWQQYWSQNAPFRALDPKQTGKMPKAYVLDMFPYPSGAGLHVGHPVGYLATDIISRFLRAKGVNVLHPMGWDAFGLPAEQYAVKTGQHPRITTEQNIATYRRQFNMLGMGYDWDREINTTDPKYYRWTQWIFLQLFNSYFDPLDQKAKPISHLLHELQNENVVVAPDGSIHVNPTNEGMDAISGELRIERTWIELDEAEQREVIDGQRLAYMDEIPVNWCPELGTVLANEEVIDGKSEVGGFPVIKQPMRQWMLRITAYSDRLIEDLKTLDWPESLKEMQRNWIGKSVGAEVDFEIDTANLPQVPQEDLYITVFTTRPDTLYGATYMVLSPEHPLVPTITSAAHRAAVDEYRQTVAAKSERDRLAETRDKTGVFTGAYAVNPMNDEKIPIWIADYVLMGYGTGAIMAVPAHDQRDYEFAAKFNLPIRPVVKPFKGDAPIGKAFEGEGIAINSPVIDGLPTIEAKEQINHIIDAEGFGHQSVKYKLRDWLFSRQRYWGEPFPIILDAAGNAHALPESELPVTLPELADFKPTGTPQPPLSKAKDWVNVMLDGKPAKRETNTMPQWAGSCWYYLRYLDPDNLDRFVDPEKEKYWMPVDLYVGGVEHAVLHLLYSRFWHKVLFDLGYVSTPEPFKRLVNQGLMLGETEYHVFLDETGKPVSLSELCDVAEEASADGVKMIAFHKQTGVKLFGKKLDESEVEKIADGYGLKSNPAIRVDARSFKMSKSRGNVVNPDQIVGDYGADTLRLYEMYMGPLETQKPWNTRDIIGMSRFLNGVYRHLVGDEELAKTASIKDEPIPDALDRQMHRTIKKVGQDIEALRFNTAIAELIKLNNEMVHLTTMPKKLAENFTLMLAPFAPHIAEEIWSRLGNAPSVSRQKWPEYDPQKLADDTMELAVQVNGKLRGTVTVATDSTEDIVLQSARQVPTVQTWLQGKTLVKQLYVAKKLVNFVVK
jgi:leucyl-tRNA synthetase